MKGCKFYYKQLGHLLENSFRKYRAYLKPYCYKKYGSVPVSKEFDSQIVSVINIEKTEIITDSGRYFQGLVKGLLDADHGVYVVRKFWVVSELSKKRYSKQLVDSGKIKFIDKEFLIENRGLVDYLWCDVVGSNNSHVSSCFFKKTVCLSISARPLEGKIWMPYQVHPDISCLPHQDDRSIEKVRKLGVFFVGNVVPAYESDFVKSHYVMSRIQVLETLTNSVPNEFKVEYEKFDGVEGQDEGLQKSVFLPLYDSEKKKSSGTITSAKYIDLLSEISFIVCTPGTYMPFAHNVIESMSQGCIPILEYAHYFTPELEDGLNCLSFSDEESLKSAIDRAITMNDDERQRMRQDVLKYYTENLKFSSFLDRVDRVDRSVEAFYYG